MIGGFGTTLVMLFILPFLNKYVHQSIIMLIALVSYAIYVFALSLQILNLMSLPAAPSAASVSSAPRHSRRSHEELLVCIFPIELFRLRGTSDLIGASSLPE